MHRWAVILVRLCLSYMATGSYKHMYTDVTGLLSIFQTAAVLEVLHTVLGLVKSNPILTGFQVMSRVFITWHVWAVPEVYQTMGPPLFLFAWSVTEVIRYAFYATNLMGSTPYFITWCRYTFFFALYPIGVTGELLSVYLTLPYVAKSGLLTASLPNKVNMSFNYYYILMVIMAIYVPIFPQLYTHMIKQRGKIIGSQHKKVE